MVELNLQWSDGRRDSISPPFPVRRRSTFFGNRHAWGMRVPNLKHQLAARSHDGVEIASVTATASFSTTTAHSSHDMPLEKSVDLILLPETNSTRFVPKLQLTTSTLEPKVGENMIFHIRSNFDLKDFYFVILVNRPVYSPCAEIAKFFVDRKS